MSDIDSGSSTAVERYVPAGELSDHQTEELAAVGLSARFPEIMLSLNDALVAAQGRSFVGYRFTLNPDPEKPHINVDTERAFPFKVLVDANRLENASFRVVTRYMDMTEMKKDMAVVKLKDLQKFAECYEGQPLLLRARLMDLSRDLPTKIDVPLDEIDNEDKLDEIGLAGARYQIMLGFEDEGNRSLAIPLTYPDIPHIGRVFMVGEISATDTAAQIEKIIEAYSQLILSCDDSSEIG